MAYQRPGLEMPGNGMILGPNEKVIYEDGSMKVVQKDPSVTTSQYPTSMTNQTTTAAPATPNPTGGTPGGDAGMTPYSGFASQYAPGTLGTVYDAPTSILPDVFQGMDAASPLYQMLAGIQADPLSLYTLLQGAGGSFETGDAGDNAFVNWLAEMYKNLGQVGGGGFDISKMLGNLFSTNTGEEESSALNQALRAGDPVQQSRLLYNLIRDASNVGMNPLAAMGYQSGMARSMDSWRNDTLRGENGANLTPLEWVRANSPHLLVGV